MSVIKDLPLQRKETISFLYWSGKKHFLFFPSRGKLSSTVCFSQTIEMKKKKLTKNRGGPGRLPADEAAKLPDRLLDAALELFNAHGYGGTSMEQIARSAGASTKTLYSRFPDKQAVAQAMISRIIQCSLAAAGATVPDPGRDPRGFLIALGTEAATNVSYSGAGLIQIALSEARHSPDIAILYNSALAQARGVFRKALEEWHAGGLLPELKDPEMAATLLVSMLTDMARIRTAMGDPMRKEEIAAYVAFATDVFLRGCGYRAD
jgi:AcrR family transcriptional regulator